VGCLAGRSALGSEVWQRLRAVFNNQGIVIQNKGVQVTSYTGASVGGGVSLLNCRIITLYQGSLDGRQRDFVVGTL
jgi:hypothetical protein